MILDLTWLPIDDAFCYYAIIFYNKIMDQTIHSPQSMNGNIYADMAFLSPDIIKYCFTMSPNALETLSTRLICFDNNATKKESNGVEKFGHK